MNLAFFGSSENSLIILKALKQAGYNIKLIVTAPPRPVGRKKVISKTSVHEYALKENIPVATPEKLEKNFIDNFTSIPFDVAIVADYARLIPLEILSHPKRGCLNLHPSLLPKYRGSSPSEAAILAGCQKTGLTIIQMDEKFDHGPIIAQFEEEIQPDDTSETLYQRLFSAGAKVLTTILPAWVEGRILPRNQDHKKASLAPRLTRDDGFIPWEIVNKAMQGKSFDPQLLNPRLRQALEQTEKTGEAEFIERATRAFHPWPGIWTIISTNKGKKRLKILSASLEDQKLILHQVQLEGQQASTFNQIKNQIL